MREGRIFAVGRNKASVTAFRSLLESLGNGWQASYLSCAFKRHVGLALEEYIKKIQFCSALRKIVAGEKQVKHIAYEAGYADPLYFGKAFKRRFGVSPQVLRADNRPPDLT